MFWMKRKSRLSLSGDRAKDAVKRSFVIIERSVNLSFAGDSR
jgi:hypothetical protein